MFTADSSKLLEGRVIVKYLSVELTIADAKHVNKASSCKTVTHSASQMGDHRMPPIISSLIHCENLRPEIKTRFITKYFKKG